MPQSELSQIDLGTIEKIVGLLDATVGEDKQIRSILDWVKKLLPILGLILPMLQKPKPEPKPDLPPDIPPMPVPDDTIPTPAPAPPAPPAPVVASIRYKADRAQYSHDRFPNEYTPANPHGMFKAREDEAIPYGSKVWFDVTPVDPDGHAHNQDDTINRGLQWVPVFHFVSNGSHVVVKDGGGESPDGHGRLQIVDDPGGGIVGVGVSAWRFSLGYLLQVQVFDEGEFETWSEFRGLESPHLRFRVS